ncbi:MAG: beta-N-acetylhexosaminidase [Bacteroidales bacterium]|nr:beta-N-acetylhexosaminidase [Bacteroidales bacterium]
MKSIFHFVAVALAAIAIFTSCGNQVSVKFREGATDPETGLACHTIVVVNPPKGLDWSVWFGMFRCAVNVQEGSTADVKHVNGTLYRLIPTEESADSIVVRYLSRPLPRLSWAPEGFSLQTADGKTVDIPVEYSFLPTETIPNFEYTKVEVAPYDIIPAVKKVEAGDESIALESKDWRAEAVANYHKVEGVPGYYRLTISKDGVNVEASDEDGAYYAGVTIDNIISNAGATVPAVQIEDWPDLPYRGVMLDVSRNFTTKDNVLKFIDLMSRYKLNVLHLHLGDDEGWRVAVDGLPELTSFGAFHALPVINEDGSISEPVALEPSYSCLYNSKDACSNGYYTKEDYIEILKCANAHHIRVIPEFDCPGHSRACIKAMQHRFEVTGDDSCLLYEASDTSKYMSVQDYPDNAVNVALESTYTFFDKVFASMVSVYAEAGAPLPSIHIGGDEVAHGAWLGSPACQELLVKLREDNPDGLSDTNLLKGYFINRMMDIADAHGVALDGWQEITQNIDTRVFNRLIDGRLGSVNIWSTIGSRETLPYKQANMDVPVVLSNVTNTYADLAYNHDRNERGHQWGGFVDERRAFSLLPFDLYRSVRWDDYGKIKDLSNVTEGKEVLVKKQNIIGVQVQLWTETIRNYDYVTYYIFPKMLGVFERGWNASPAWEGIGQSDAPEFMDDFNRFYSKVVEHEMPYYEANGICYRKRQ